MRYVDPSGHRVGGNSWGGHATDDAGDGSTSSGMFNCHDTNDHSSGNDIWDGYGNWSWPPASISGATAVQKAAEVARKAAMEAAAVNQANNSSPKLLYS